MKSVDNVNKTAVADEVFEVLHEVMHLFRAHGGRAPEEGGLSRMEARVLGFFSRRPGATLSDLVVHSGRDKSQLAKLVAGLREQGLLDAQPDEADRRNIRLQPTAAAQALHRAAQARHRQRARKAVEGLTARECEQLLSLMGRVRESLAADRDAG